MKRWTLASTSVALVAVTSGAVAVIGPEGRHRVDAGRAVLATPSGVEKVSGGSPEALQRVRDELARSLAARAEANRAAQAEVEALRGKAGRTLPPGATLASLMAALRAAYAKGDPEEIRQGVQLLQLLGARDQDAFDGILRALRENRDPGFASLLCSSLWGDGGKRLEAAREAVVKIFLDGAIPIVVRARIVEHLWQTLAYSSSLADGERASLLRAAQTLDGSTEASYLRRMFLYTATQRLAIPSDAWNEFQRYLAVEPDDSNRREALRTFFQQATRSKASAAAEGLLLETLKGRFGASAAAERLDQPLLSWFTAENGPSFADALGLAAAQLPDAAKRQAVAGQLGLLLILQRSPAAREALGRLHAAETDASARERMGDVIQASDKGTLDLDRLMDRLQLKWSF